MIDINKYFVLVPRRDAPPLVQEVEAKIFAWLQQAPRIDPTSNEINLITLERYPKLGNFEITEEIAGHYAGVGKVGTDLMPIYHYFLSLRMTNLKMFKRKPFFIQDNAVLQQQTPK